MTGLLGYLTAVLIVLGTFGYVCWYEWHHPLPTHESQLGHPVDLGRLPNDWQ